MSVCSIEIPTNDDYHANAVEIWADSYEAVEWIRICNNDGDSISLSSGEAVQMARAILGAAGAVA